MPIKAQWMLDFDERWSSLLPGQRTLALTAAQTQKQKGEGSIYSLPGPEFYKALKDACDFLDFGYRAAPALDDTEYDEIIAAQDAMDNLR